MDYKEYLINQSDVQLSAVASLMWPTNKNAKVYLSMKLKGARPWTESDNEKAEKALHALGRKLIKLPNQ